MKKEEIKIAPSILAADFGKLAEEAKRLELAGADSIHIDIMDGNFAPNLTMGTRAVAAINRATDINLDVHLMVYQPYDYIESFVQAGADSITIHFEATEDVEETLSYIRKCNVKAGLAFNPDTSESLIVKYLNKCDLLLLMTVNPGFCGQEFLPAVLDKVRFTRNLCEQLNLKEGGQVPQGDEEIEEMSPFMIQVDGGINQETAKDCIEAGANVLVSGSHLFAAENMELAIQEMRNAGAIKKLKNEKL